LYTIAPRQPQAATPAAAVAPAAAMPPAAAVAAPVAAAAAAAVWQQWQQQRQRRYHGWLETRIRAALALLCVMLYCGGARSKGAGMAIAWGLGCAAVAL
jgi:hypothetical protein